MINYGGREMAESFRTVRKNTITLAEEIAADQYAYRPTPDSRSVRELLAHIATTAMWQIEIHDEHLRAVSFELFCKRVAEAAATEQALITKEQILQALRTNGEKFGAFLDAIPSETLGELVSFPPPVKPESRTRFEMLLGAKEHEMHHRAQLMVYQRLLGIVPHLTRSRQQTTTQAPART
jgi:uncharacterized damage-inducible protein DinB